MRVSCAELYARVPEIFIICRSERNDAPDNFELLPAVISSGDVRERSEARRSRETCMVPRSRNNLGVRWRTLFMVAQGRPELSAVDPMIR